MAENPTTVPAGDTPPAPEYDTLTVEQITAWATTATSNKLTLAILYESTHQNRADVLAALDAANAASAEKPPA
jgi:hypothetical protein